MKGKLVTEWDIIVPTILPNSVFTIPTFVVWPESTSPGSVLLFRFQLQSPSSSGNAAKGFITTNDYWLSNLETNHSSSSSRQDYRSLASLREKGNLSNIQVSATCVPENGSNIKQSEVNSYFTHIQASLTLLSSSLSTAFGVRLVLRKVANATDNRVLPYWQSDNYFVMVPGEVKILDIAVNARTGFFSNEIEDFALDIDGFNVVQQRVLISC